MPIPRAVAKVNRVVSNRVLGPLARVLPAFGVIEHVGRKSGRVYRTPVNVFRSPGGYTVALTYGKESDWVQNVLAAGDCILETRGRKVRLTAPRLYHDEQRRAVPWPVRLVLGRINVSDFLELRLAA